MKCAVGTKRSRLNETKSGKLLGTGRGPGRNRFWKDEEARYCRLRSFPDLATTAQGSKTWRPFKAAAALIYSRLDAREVNVPVCVRPAFKNILLSVFEAEKLSSGGVAKLFFKRVGPLVHGPRVSFEGQLRLLFWSLLMGLLLVVHFDGYISMLFFMVTFDGRF